MQRGGKSHVENVRIASTRLAGMRPVGPAAARDFDRLVGVLALPSGAPANLASLFSEPVPSRDRNAIDWYGPGDKTYIALTSLPDDQRVQVLARVDELL